jgi:hypothetical protein
MQILKAPEFENDDYLFRIDVDCIPVGQKAIDIFRQESPSLASYYETKRKAFRAKNVDPSVFADFEEDRPSLNSLSKLKILDSTIYTVASERQNGYSYLDLLDRIRQHISLHPSTRRCMVRLANSYAEYSSSEIDSQIDVTCLNLVHYIGDTPRLIFRASDVKNELFVDLLTIHEFFIQPVYEGKAKQLSVYSSSAQGVSSWQNFVDYVNRFTKKG